MKALLCFLIALCALASQASAKAYFQSKKEMIETAEVIAVITIADVKAAEKTTPFSPCKCRAMRGILPEAEKANS